MSTNIYQVHSETPSADKAEIAARIEGLTPRIIAYAGFVYSPELDREDIQQEMVKAILEQAQKDPDFIHQKDSYLLKLATWKAQAVAARTRVYDNRVTEEPEEFDIFDASASADPADLYEHQETMEELLEAIQKLSPENIQVVKMIYLGYSQKEISEKLNVSPAAVSQRKQSIRHAARV